MIEFVTSPGFIELQRFALIVAAISIAIGASTLIGAWLMRRRSESMRYALLLTGLLVLLANPVLIALGQAATPWFIDSTEVTVEVVRFPAEMLPMLLDQPQAAPVDEVEAAFPLMPLLGLIGCALWLAGTALVLAWMLRRFTKRRHTILTEVWQPEFWTDEIQARLAEKVGLRTFPDVRLSPSVPMPVVIGYWRPTIILPEKTPTAWDQRQWEAVLLHEAAHIARRDQWAALAQRLAVACFWWCPLVYRINARLSALRETICDDFALEGSCDAIAYAELLVETAEQMVNLNPTPMPMPVALLDSAQGGLESRVARLFAKEKKPMTKLSLTGKCLGVCLLTATALLTMTAAALSGGQPEPAKKIQIKIIIDGKEIDLSDVKLWQHLQAVQAKPAPKDQPAPNPKGDAKFFEKKVIHGFIPVNPAIPVGQNKDIITTEKDGKVVITDATTGKVIAMFERAKHGAGPMVVPFQSGQVRGLIQMKHDPRIEELVKQAEAIKPGSGMAVRMALQGGPNFMQGQFQVAPQGAEGKAVPFHGGPNWGGGRAVIIIADKDGKPRQLTEEEMKKIMGGHGHGHFPIDPQMLKKFMPANPGKPGAGPIEFEFEFVPAKKAVTKPMPPLADPLAKPIPPMPPMPATRPAELDELRRQFDRLNAELNALRKRVESQK